MKTITPLAHQAPLNLDHLILKNAPPVGEAVPMDVVFVGAGPAGLSGAIHLANLIKKHNASGGTLGDIQIGVLEKAANLGGHTLSGAVMNPRAIRELFPDLKDEELPFRKKVQGDRVYMLTENGKIRLPTPPPMHNDGNFVVSLCEVVRFLGQKAEALGVNIFNSFPADSLLTDGQNVLGVRTTSAGQKRDGSPGPQFMPPNDITAKVTVLTDGTRSSLAQAYCRWQKTESDQPQIYALGVKEIWRVKKAPKEVTHTLGYPLPTDAFGGSWMYPLAEDMISFGLVVGLDYKSHNLDVHKYLQRLKKHPLFAEYLEGGEIVEWGAKTIPEGGLNSLPKKLHGDGLLIAGDAAGFVNVPALKGIHYAMQSGMYAAETIFEALKKNDFTSRALSSFDVKVKDSYIHKDLYKVRNMRQAFKSGFYLGGIKAGLMTATMGAFPGGGCHHVEDAAEAKNITDSAAIDNVGISKVDAVYLAGNKTRDDIPQHLTVGKDISPEVADMYAALCPAGVYERQGDKLIVNAPNCIDCKATDVIGPRWQPREGGAGPDYKLM
jgi:electron-transferring-flavoprotein dehydrogenase